MLFARLLPWRYRAIHCSSHISIVLSSGSHITSFSPSIYNTRRWHQTLYFALSHSSMIPTLHSNAAAPSHHCAKAACTAIKTSSTPDNKAAVSMSLSLHPNAALPHHHVRKVGTAIKTSSTPDNKATQYTIEMHSPPRNRIDHNRSRIS